jgi:alkylresorcinol/alkylpyrone synthase
VHQEEIVALLQDRWAGEHFNPQRLAAIHRATRVATRHLALPLERYEGLRTFAQRNDAWITAAAELGERAVRDALERAGLAPGDVDHLFFTTVTGIATPSIDALLANRLPLRSDVKRTPIFGLGCVAGAAGIARAADVLRGGAREVAVLLSVELCSLTFQREDHSMAGVVAGALFGDGAAAAVLCGPDCSGARRGAGAGPRPRVRATRSIFYPGTERIMGWDLVEGGFQIVLSPTVPELIRQHLGQDVDRFLRDQGLERGRIRHLLAHTGGPAILDAVQAALELPDGALDRSWRSLSEVGNLSSAAVLFLLGDLFEGGEAEPGDLGLLFAMGPGWCSELVLLEWGT